MTKSENDEAYSKMSFPNMRPNQIYSNGIITNSFRLERYRVQRSITFIAELTTLALVLAVVVALAIVIQPI
jgi:hypothetical protein